MEASSPAPIKVAVTDTLVYGDLASPRWTSPGPAGSSARSPRRSATPSASSTSLVRPSVVMAQPATAREWISTTKAA